MSTLLIQVSRVTKMSAMSERSDICRTFRKWGRRTETRPAILRSKDSLIYQTLLRGLSPGSEADRLKKKSLTVRCFLVHTMILP